MPVRRSNRPPRHLRCDACRPAIRHPRSPIRGSARPPALRPAPAGSVPARPAHSMSASPPKAWPAYLAPVAARWTLYITRMNKAGGAMTRTIVEISGTDAVHFLQGLITNDTAHLADGLVYAAILTPQGKYLADFFLLAHGDSILMDVDETLAQGLMQRLNMYKLRADVQITESDLKLQCGTGPAPEGALPDPRHPDMGWRLYGPEGGDDGTDWKAIRVAHCIPETGIELGADTFILEAGFGRLHGVDFKKGCYVGQEVTARMKHKTE